MKNMKNIAILLLGLFIGSMNAQDIKLPEPTKTGGMPLMEALAKRSTSRQFASTELTKQQISNLLWAAFGINRPDGKRTAPSARNFQETDIYVLMKSGTYIYDAKTNTLNLIVADDLRSIGGSKNFADAPRSVNFGCRSG